MSRKPFWVVVCMAVCFLGSLALCSRSWAQQLADGQSAVNPLVRVLQAKGILSGEEVAQLIGGSVASAADRRLAKLLLFKGVISQADYEQTVGTPGMINASNTETSSATAIAAVYRVPVNNGASVAPARTPPPEGPKVVPAVAPLRVLPIDIAKQGGLIPDIKLGSGANMKLYGFFKASAVSDTANCEGGWRGRGSTRSWVEACRGSRSLARIGPSILRRCQASSKPPGRPSEWAPSGSAHRCLRPAYNFTLGI